MNSMNLMTPMNETFVQLGYLTRDLDGAVNQYRQKHRVPEFLVLESRAGSVRAAFAYRGGVMIEIIEPVAGAEGIYAGWLPERADAVRLHHIGYLVTDLDSAIADYRGAGYQVPVRRSTGRGISLAYVDTRADTGHYTELIELAAEGRALYERIPRC